MMTHASTTFEPRRSFSVHVLTTSRGSKSLGRRSSFTMAWSRMGPRTKGPRLKKVATSGLLPGAREADDRAEGNEQDPRRLEEERDLRRQGDGEGKGEHAGDLDEHDVADPQHEAERDEPHPRGRVPVAVDGRGWGRRRSRSGRHGDRGCCGRTPFARRGLGGGAPELLGGILPTRPPPPARVLCHPA